MRPQCSLSQKFSLEPGKNSFNDLKRSKGIKEMKTPKAAQIIKEKNSRKKNRKTLIFLVI